MSTKTIYVLPPSYAQQRLWLVCQMDKSGYAYNMVQRLRLKGDLQVEALERSLNEIIRRHETLRTSFVETKGEPQQVIRGEARLHLQVEAVAGLSIEERRAVALAEAQQEAKHRFDLGQWPLLQVRLLRVSEGEHLLVLVMHHIISDDWSLGVLFRELGALYEAYSRGEESGLEELEVQYADYAAWQREWLESGELARQLGYWREQLAGAPPVLELPTDYGRPAVQSSRGSRVKVGLSREVTARLKEVSRQEGATLFMSLLAAYAVLLSRYSQQEEVVVGTPVANRNRVELEGLIGFFVNILVLRVKLGPEASYREVLRGVREMALGAYAHQDVPFEKLVEELQPERDLSRTPLFQVVFTLENQPRGERKLGNVSLEVLRAASETSKFDLTLNLIEGTEGIQGEIRYNEDLYKANTIERMARHYERLIAEVVANPDKQVSELEMMSAAERQQILVEWIDTARPNLGEVPIHKLVEAQAAKNPEALAVTSATGDCTYHQLNTQANRLGHLLRELGVEPETVVGICMDRSINLIASQLAVLKTGGAFLPIDPSYPRERVAYMLESSHSSILLTEQAQLNRLSGLAPYVISVEAIKGGAEDKTWENPRVEVAPGNLAYVIYTSGSTGRPKGVGITHASLSNLVDWHQQDFQISGGDRVTLLAGVSFDASIWEVWPYLSAGASLHIPNEQIRANIGRLVQWINEASITICFLPTPVAELALAEAWPASTALRILHIGGEMLHWPSGTQYPFQIINNYGPTENTVVATSVPINCDVRHRSVPPIGRPVSYVKVYVLDRSLQPVPIGAKADLYIGGRSLARGYIDQPDLTAERFIPNPYAEQEGERLYKTGDVVRYLEDGNLEFCGRSDEQIKIRGYRIEPGEIEAVLLDYPGVNAAAVIVNDLPGGQPQLVAYVASPMPSSEHTCKSLKTHLSQKLASYMIPAKFVFLETLPLTTNGKLDKRKLPVPETNVAAMEDEAFSSPMEETLASVWTEILGVNRVGRRDNFFDAGGHSLAAMRLVAKVREVFGIHLDIRHVFEAPTLAGLAELIAQTPKETCTPVEKIKPVGNPQVPAQLDHLSDDDVDTLLKEMIEVR